MTLLHVVFGGVFKSFYSAHHGFSIHESTGRIVFVGGGVSIPAELVLRDHCLDVVVLASVKTLVVLAS